MQGALVPPWDACDVGSINRPAKFAITDHHKSHERQYWQHKPCGPGTYQAAMQATNAMA
jgi:hypothetical protein